MTVLANYMLIINLEHDGEQLSFIGSPMFPCDGPLPHAGDSLSLGFEGATEEEQLEADGGGGWPVPQVEGLSWEATDLSRVTIDLAVDADSEAWGRQLMTWLEARGWSGDFRSPCHTAELDDA